MSVDACLLTLRVSGGGTNGSGIMFRHFRFTNRLGAVGFRVHQPCTAERGDPERDPVIRRGGKRLFIDNPPGYDIGDDQTHESRPRFCVMIKPGKGFGHGSLMVWMG